jgi:hypothetical protein
MKIGFFNIFENSSTSYLSQVSIQNNGWSIDSATEVFSEEWITDDEFFVTESEIYGNNKLYHQLKKELRIRKT